MPYAYCADLYCDDCGNAMREAIDETGRGPDDPSDEASYDSDDYPKWVSADDETDSPFHCGSGDGCPNATDGIPPLVTERLTADGVAYVREAIESADGNPAVLAMWAEEFADYLA